MAAEQGDRPADVAQFRKRRIPCGNARWAGPGQCMEQDPGLPFTVVSLPVRDLRKRVPTWRAISPTW
jgi:hypothetical protein